MTGIFLLCEKRCLGLWAKCTLHSTLQRSTGRPVEAAGLHQPPSAKWLESNLCHASEASDKYEILAHLHIPLSSGPQHLDTEAAWGRRGGARGVVLQLYNYIIPVPICNIIIISKTIKGIVSVCVCVCVSVCPSCNQYKYLNVFQPIQVN